MSRLDEFEQILRRAVAAGATDLWLLADEPPAYRVNGRVERVDAEPLTSDRIQAWAATLFGAERITRLGEHSGMSYRCVRLADDLAPGVTVAQSGGNLSLWARPMSHFIFDPALIRVPEAVLDALDKPGGGLGVVTGLSGSGKTTTCYSLVEHINATRDAHLVLVERFVEYLFEPKRCLVQQRQVGVDAPDILSAIRAALLQSADVLFIGEISDPEALPVCLSAAETGLFTLLQLHQPSPEAAISLMIELQEASLRPRFCQMLARSLRFVLAQQLLPRTDRGKVPAYGLFIPDDAQRAQIAAGAAATLRTPDAQTITADVRRLEQEGLISSETAAMALRQTPG